MPNNEKTLMILDDKEKTKSKSTLEKFLKLKKGISQLGIFIFFAIYTVAGAKIFQELEHPWEVERQRESGLLIIDERRFLIKQLEHICATESTNFSESVSVSLREYEKIIAITSQDGVDFLRPNVTHYKWNFVQSVFFASTVITTIGYGNIAPMTTGGRIFCIAYGFIGIPVTVTVIAELGTIFANMISKIYKRIHHSIRRKTPTSKGKERRKLFGDKTKRGLMVLGAVVAWLVYLSVGARLFISWEDWSFLEGFYFCFITMTTIGLGDFVPERKEFMLVCTIYILIGLALTSTIIELIRRQYAESWQQMKELSGRLGELSGPLAEQLKRLGQHDLSLDLNISSELKELRNAIQLYRIEALSMLEPKMRNDNHLAEILRSHLEEANKERDEEHEKLLQKKKVIQVIIYESSV